MRYVLTSVSGDVMQGFWLYFLFVEQLSKLIVVIHQAQYDISVCIGYLPSFFLPPRAESSIKNVIPTIFAFRRLTSSIAAAIVPPVASRSSTSRTEAPCSIASLCISMVSVPYSRSYSTDSVICGSFPGLRIGMNPAPRVRATAAPKINPRASIAAT